MKKPVILDLCGGTGAWSKPYENNGYRVVNITHPDFDVRKWFIFEDQIGFVKHDGNSVMIDIDSIYGVLAAPPCTMFSYARTRSKRPRDLNEGMELVHECLKIIWELQKRPKSEHQKNPPLKFWALENPCSMLRWFLGKPALTFDPYEYGDSYSKKTCIWGWFNEPKKQAGENKHGKFDKLKMDQLKEIRSVGEIGWKDAKNRKELRSITPQGFALSFYEANHEQK